MAQKHSELEAAKRTIMNKTLNDEEKEALKVLYEELTRNPQTSLTGIEEKTLGYKVGAYLGISVMYSVAL